MATNLIGLGKTVVAVAGTPVLVVIPTHANGLPVINPARCHAFIVQALSGNTGKVYVGTTGLVKSTLANVLVVLAVPATNVIPTLSVAVQQAANSLGLDDVYIDADVNGDGVLISVMIA